MQHHFERSHLKELAFSNLLVLFAADPIPVIHRWCVCVCVRGASVDVKCPAFPHCVQDGSCTNLLHFLLFYYFLLCFPPQVEDIKKQQHQQQLKIKDFVSKCSINFILHFETELHK